MVTYRLIQIPDQNSNYVLLKNFSATAYLHACKVLKEQSILQLSRQILSYGKWTVEILIQMRWLLCHRFCLTFVQCVCFAGTTQLHRCNFIYEVYPVILQASGSLDILALSVVKHLIILLSENALKNTVLIVHMHSTFSYLDRLVPCFKKKPKQKTMKEPAPCTD